MVRFLSGGDIDFVDPGQTYSTFGYMVQYAVNRPLYSYTTTWDLSFSALRQGG